jgi:cytochrome c oxidase assembly protein subunit 11
MSAELPLQFIVDQDLPRDIGTITLSYTIFDVTDMVGAAVVAR